MRLTIGIAIGLLVLMVAAALIGLRVTRTVDAQLGELIHDYFRLMRHSLERTPALSSGRPTFAA